MPSVTSVDTKPSSKPSASACDGTVNATQTVTLALVGLNFGSGIARHINDNVPSLNLVGVCDQDVDKAQTLADSLGTKVYESLDAILRDDSVEAVGLFTGPHKRASLISKILKSGRHLITTKPFELDLTDAKQVLEEADKRGLVVHLNSPAPLLSEDLQVIKKWVEIHKLGRPLSMHAQTWANYREEANGSWYDDPRLCPAAPILRLGIYFLNDFAPLLGKPERVFASESRLFTQKPTSDHAQVSIAYEGGALATVFSSFCIGDGEPYRDQVLLQYEKATIRRWMVREPLSDMSQDYAILELTLGGRTQQIKTSPGAYAGWYQWEAFTRAVRERRPCTIENKTQILHGLQLLDAIRRSLESGLPVAVIDRV